MVLPFAYNFHILQNLIRRDPPCQEKKSPVNPELRLLPDQTSGFDDHLSTGEDGES